MNSGYSGASIRRDVELVKPPLGVKVDTTCGFNAIIDLPATHTQRNLVFQLNWYSNRAKHTAKMYFYDKIT